MHSMCVCVCMVWDAVWMSVIELSAGAVGKKSFRGLRNNGKCAHCIVSVSVWEWAFSAHREKLKYDLKSYGRRRYAEKQFFSLFS